jgi:signal transduction histidine kinase
MQPALPSRVPTRPRILIVDDELGVRESLKAILSPDYEILTASSGDEALALVRKETVDLVTLDLRMPGMGGIAVLEQIKKYDPEIEAIILTGYGSLDTAVQGLRHHAYDYLSKPFDCDQVRRVVGQAVARRTALQRLRAAPEALLAALSHEFRTPLNVIIGYSTMLGDEAATPLSDEQKLALDRIQSNSTALLAYVETLFYMVELDRGLVPVTRGPVALGPLLLGIQRELATLAGVQGVTLTVDAAPALVVTSDEDKLTRLVRALAENAIRHSGGGAVTLAATRDGADVRLEIRDMGPGIVPELVAETEGVIQGRSDVDPPRLLGFGLRLVGRLVRVLGLGLGITTGPGGTTFAVRLPVVATAVDGPTLAPGA